MIIKENAAGSLWDPLHVYGITVSEHIAWG